MFRGTSVSKTCLRGILRGFDLRSHFTNLSQDLLVRSRTELAELASSIHHDSPTTELWKSEIPSFFAHSRLPTSSASRAIATGTQPYHLRGNPSHIYPIRNNNPSKILAPSRRGTSSKWYSTGGPAGPASGGASTEISKFWDGLCTLLEVMLNRGKYELAMITNQTNHIISRTEEYHEVEPGNCYKTGPHVYTKVLTARTKLKDYTDLLMSANLLVGMDQEQHDRLTKLERELLRLDNKLEKCQNRLRARELDSPKRRDEEKGQVEESLIAPCALAHTQGNDSGICDDYSTDGFDGIGL
ncbi:hypothetical protein PG993_014394 [Apiospora rasikravindrae]|uniref:Uncharacterized protein n=1 Tax=Apiospora rasikravindrae TaxID=990691 RepID=A0ABR1RP07_9PEZI